MLFSHAIYQHWCILISNFKKRCMIFIKQVHVITSNCDESICDTFVIAKTVESISIRHQSTLTHRIDFQSTSIRGSLLYGLTLLQCQIPRLSHILDEPELNCTVYVESISQHRFPVPSPAPGSDLPVCMSILCG